MFLEVRCKGVDVILVTEEKIPRREVNSGSKLLLLTFALDIAFAYNSFASSKSLLQNFSSASSKYALCWKLCWQDSAHCCMANLPFCPRSAHSCSFVFRKTQNATRALKKAPCVWMNKRVLYEGMRGGKYQIRGYRRYRFPIYPWISLILTHCGAKPTTKYFLAMSAICS